MSDLYNLTAERLWEKFEFYRDQIDISCVVFPTSFPIDDLRSKNEIVNRLIKEVEEEYDYQMSEYQCSWATVQFIKGGLEMMKKFNHVNSRDLKPRP